MALSERLEVCDTIERLREELETLVVRGLASATPQDLKGLQAMQEDLARMGVTHLAGRLAELLDAARSGDRGAAKALFRVQATLRVTERVLTLDTVGALLEPPADEEGEEGEEGEDDGGDDDGEEEDG